MAGGGSKPGEKRGGRQKGTPNTVAKRKKAAGGYKPNHALTVEQATDETGAQAIARKLLEPHLRHALSASDYAGKVLGNDIEGPGIMDFVDHVQEAGGKAEAGDLAIASHLLAAQAITLDSMFTEMARRAAANLGKHFNAAERYARLALKAQSNSRANIGSTSEAAPAARANRPACACE